MRARGTGVKDGSHEDQVGGATVVSDRPPKRGVQVTVFTNRECPFCQVVLDMVHRVAADLDSLGQDVVVRQEEVGTQLVVHGNRAITRVPTVAVGTEHIEGFPDWHQLVTLVYRAVLLGGPSPCHDDSCRVCHNDGDSLREPSCP